MKKYIFNLIKFSLALLIIPIGVFLVDPYNYYKNSFKIDIDRMHLFRINNVADWAMVEVGKIDESLKAEVKTCVIGDSRSRLMVSSGHRGGWTTRICGIELDILDLSFGGANLDESFSVLENEIKELDSLERIIVSVPIDRLLIENHDVNRISSSSFNSSISGIKYLTDVNLVASIYENRKSIVENRKKIKNDTLKAKEKEEVGDVGSQNAKISQNKIDTNQIKWRKRIVEFKKERFESTLKNRDKTIPVAKARADRDNKIRQSFLRIYQVGNRTLFDNNLDILKAQLSKYSNNYEVILMIPTYDDILNDSITKNHNEDYKYYIESLKRLPYKVINLHDMANEFIFVDPVHGNFENGTLTHKINYELPLLDVGNENWTEAIVNESILDSLELGKSYLSIYSQIYNNTQHQVNNFTAMVSLRNTSETDTIYVLNANYHDSQGKLIKAYFKKFIQLLPLETVDIVIGESDISRGSGSNFIFDWKIPANCSEPIFEAVMSPITNHQGLSFTTQAKRIN